MTELAYAIIVGIIGYLLGSLQHRGTLKVLREQVQYFRHESTEATERLIHAWKDDAKIPPRPIAPPPPLDPLPQPLLDELAQWEDAEHRATIEAAMRLGLARGKGIPAILLELDNHHPE